MENEIELKKEEMRMEIEEVEPGIFGKGDYVTRDGSDIHYVEKFSTGNILVVCIVPPSSDWTDRGETESNCVWRYCRINKHFLPFAKSEHEKLKKLHPDGWKE